MFEASVDEGITLIPPHRSIYHFRSAMWENPTLPPQSLLKDTLLRWLSEYNTALFLNSFKSHPLPPVTYWYRTIWQDEHTLILPDNLHDSPKHGLVEIPMTCTEGPMSQLDMQYDSPDIFPYGRPTIPISDKLRYFLSKPRDRSVETEPPSTHYWMRLNPDVPVKAEDMPQQ